MNNDNGKISIRQATLLFIVMFCAPTIRYIPLYTAEAAKQAAWLSPLVATVWEIIYMFVWMQFLKKHSEKSFVVIIQEITGKFLGKIICLLYFLWLTLLLSYNIRMYAERIITTTMPGVSIFVVVAVMLLLVGYIGKYGIVPLAKMCELFFIAIMGIFFIFDILILPKMQLENLYPITLKDALPVLKGSLGVIAIFAYNILIFIFNDKIDYKQGDFKKISIKTIIIITIIATLSTAIPLAVFGWSVVIKMPIPFINTMMEISWFDIIERMEAAIIVLWIMADFVLISLFVYAAIHMIRVTFNLSNVSGLSTMFILSMFFVSIFLADSTVELRTLSESILTPSNIIFGYAIPILLFGIGKIRKKV